MSSSSTSIPQPSGRTSEEVSLVSLVLFAAVGILVFTIVFLFVKRQITRFSLKSQREPHKQIGADAPKELRQQILRLLENTANVRFEPKLLREEDVPRFRAETKKGTCHYYYRMKACDAMSLLDKELQAYSVHIRRKPHQDIRQFLLGLRTTGPLKNASTELVHNFCRAYDHAKHDPELFALPEYCSFMDLLKELINCVLVNKATKNNSQELLTLTPGGASVSETTTLKTDILMHSGREQLAHGKLDLHLPLLHSNDGHMVTSLHSPTSEERESLLDEDDDDTLINEDDDATESGSVATTTNAELKPLMSQTSTKEYESKPVSMVTYIQPGSSKLTHRLHAHQSEQGLLKDETNL